MASLQTVVELIFSATDNASQAVKNIGNSLSELDGQVQGIAAPFASFADGLLKAEAAALAMATAVGVVAVKEAITFQDSLYLVQKQLGDSGVSIDDARKKIEELGLTYGTNANEVAKSVAGFLAAGYDYETAAKLVETSTQLMIAGELEASFAVDAINKSMAGFRVPANEAADSATKVGDILNKIGDISSGSFEEIVTGFSRISPTAKDAGLSMEETAAIIASLVDIFGSGEVAATALKSGLLSLLTPSNEAAAALEALGVANTNSNGELRSSKEILADLAGRWNTLTDAQKQQTAAVIFGKDQAGAMSAVLGDWAKVQGYVNQLVDENTGAVGSMAKEVAGKLDLIEIKVGKADEAWRQFLENLGARLLNDPEKNLAGVFEAVSQLGDAFKTVVNQGGLDPLINLVQRQAGEFASLVSSIAKNLPEAFANVDFSGLVDSLEILGDQVSNLFKAFFGDIDITTVDGLTKALQFLADGFEALTVTVAGILVQFEPLVTALREGVIKFGELDRASQLEFGSFLGAMKMVVDLGTGLGLVLVGIGEAGIKMGGVMDIVFGGVRVAINTLQVAFDTFALAVVGTLGIITKAAYEMLDALGFDDAAARIKGAFDSLGQLAGGIEQNLTRNALEFKDATEQVARGWETVTGSGGEAGESLQDVRQRLLEARDAAKETAPSIEQAKDEIYELGQVKIEPLEVFEALPEQAEEAKQGIEKVTAASGELVPKLVEVRDANGQLVRTYTDLVPAGEKMAGTFSVIGKGMEDTASAGEKAEKALKDLTDGGKLTVEQLLEITKATNDFEIKMEEIASNERIKNIEAKVELDIARLEADTKKVEAAFESINTTVQSTGDVLSGLYDNFTGTDDRWKELDIETWIDEENARRDKAMEMQNKLIQAQIDEIKARADAMNRGDAMITVDGDGLAPHLEAFMWEILKAIQVRASADMQEFLLGV